MGFSDAQRVCIELRNVTKQTDPKERELLPLPARHNSSTEKQCAQRDSYRYTLHPTHSIQDPERQTDRQTPRTTAPQKNSLRRGTGIAAPSILNPNIQTDPTDSSSTESSPRRGTAIATPSIPNRHTLNLKP
jgi:hypothetical protein